MDKWLVLVASGVRIFFFSGVLKANGVIMDDTVNRLKTSHTVVAWAFALQNGVSYMASPVTRGLLQFFGMRHVAVFGGAIVGAAYIYCGLEMDSVLQLFVVYVTSGIGFGFLHLPMYFGLQAHFEERFPTMLSVCSVFNFVGIAVMPPLFQFWKTEYGTDGAYLLTGALLLNLVVSGTCLRDPKRNGDVNREVTPADQNSQNQEEKYKSSRILRIFNTSPLFNHKLFGILVVMESVIFFVFTSWALFLVSVGTSIGLSADDAVLLSTAGGIGGFFGKISAVILFNMDRMDPCTAGLIPMTVTGFCLFSCTFVSNFYILAFVTFCTGLSHGISSSGLAGLLPSVVCKDHFQQGAVIMYTLDGVGMQLGGLISGAIQDVFGSPLYVFRVDAIVCLLAAPLALIWACSNGKVKECERV